MLDVERERFCHRLSIDARRRFDFAFAIRFRRYAAPRCYFLCCRLFTFVDVMRFLHCHAIADYAAAAA